jgi:hypothetical protein
MALYGAGFVKIRAQKTRSGQSLMVVSINV